MGYNIKIDEETKQKIKEEYEVVYKTRSDVIGILQEVMDELNTIVPNPEVQNLFITMQGINEEHIEHNSNLEIVNNDIEKNLEELFMADEDVAKEIKAKMEE